MVGSGRRSAPGASLLDSACARSESRPEPTAARRRRGARRAASTLTILLAAAAACSEGGDADEAGVATTATVVRTTAAEVPLTEGDCGDVPRLQVGGALDPSAFVGTACEQPHTVEIGPVFDYPAGGDVDFPGAGNVDGYATDECIDRFAAYVGADYLSSAVDFLIVAPDADGWDDGDRRIACILYRADFEQLTVPLEGSGL